MAISSPPPKTLSAVSDFNRAKEEELAQAKAKSLGLEYANLENYPTSFETLHLLDTISFAGDKIIPYLKAGNLLKVALISPLSDEENLALTTACQKLGVTPKPILVSTSSFDYLKKAFSSSAPSPQVTSTSGQAVTKEYKITSLSEFANLASKTSITELLDNILSGAAHLRASDIHFEPKEKKTSIRLRIDGVLHEAGSLSLERYKNLLSRIMILANLKLETIPHPQDGRFGFVVSGKQFDVRVNSLPTIYGIGIVMRLLEQERGLKGINELGFRDDLRKTILEALKKPYGLILVTGPTGSGKTTTLYALLQELNKPEKKIITLEDPVEYRLEGVVQCQIDENLDFVEGLKSALRQDPDIILVGEIRDLETASVAINAGLTGHLILSTLHTNNAPSAFARLVDLGVPTFLLSGSINLIIAQRLVRRLCNSCKQPVTPPAVFLSAFRELLPNAPPPKEIFSAKGCSECGGTGYFDRIAIAEILGPTPTLEKLMLAKVPLRDVEEEAKKEGMTTMEQDGLLKVTAGITSFEEVWRVIKE